MRHPPAGLGGAGTTGRRGTFGLLTLWLAIATVVAPLAFRLPAGAEASLAGERATRAFPPPDALVAVAVYARSTGLTDPDRAKVSEDRAAFARYAQAGQVPEPQPSTDGQAMVLAFALAGDHGQQSAAVGRIRDQLAADTPTGRRTAPTGSAGAEGDVFDAVEGMDTALLLAAGAAVALLLLIARYREELCHHPDRHDAMAVALRRSLPTILASAGTVVAGLLCLLAAQLPATHGLGPVCAVGVAAALLVMTVLLPAIFVLFGRWLCWPFVPRHQPDGRTGAGDPAARYRLWGRIARIVGWRPRTVWIGTAAALATLVLGVGNLSIGLPADEAFTTAVGSVTGQHLIEAHYPGGAVEPETVLTDAAVADQVTTVARAVDGVAGVLPAQRSADGRWARIQVILRASPDTPAAKQTVTRLRAAVHRIPGAHALVGGRTATELDADRTVRRDNLIVMPLILAVVLLILVILLRALVAPLILMASVVLSYGAALGAAGLILAAMGHPRLWRALPLQAFLFLVALGVDYTIFLMTRAREETARLGHRRGVLHALTVTGGVITSAGVVLAATYAALGVLPLVPSVQVGVLVAVGVLLDTVAVRSLLIPALALHTGTRTWWPGSLSRQQTRHPASRPPQPVPIACSPGTSRRPDVRVGPGTQRRGHPRRCGGSIAEPHTHGPTRSAAGTTISTMAYPSARVVRTVTWSPGRQ